MARRVKWVSCPFCQTRVEFPEGPLRGATCPGCRVGLPHDTASASDNQGPLFRKGGMASGRADHKIKYGFKRSAPLAGLAVLAVLASGCAAGYQGRPWFAPIVCERVTRSFLYGEDLTLATQPDRIGSARIYTFTRCQ